MRSEEYQRLQEAEGQLWWFRALHLHIMNILPDQLRGKNLLALDIGCGTGGLLSKLAKAGFIPTGLEHSPIALNLAVKQTRSLVMADANHVPFDSAYDLVVSIDILETESIEPGLFVDSALRAIKPGGYGLFVMAAHQWLLSEHDRAVNSVRRFNLVQMKALFQRPGVKILRATYLFFLLFPLIALRKLLNPKQQSEIAAESDVRLIPKAINELLYVICYLEGLLLRVVSLPIGSSALILLKKDV